METLMATLDYLSKKYGLIITIKDFTYLIIKKPPFERLSYEYQSHRNTYCAYVKSKKEAYRHCVIASHARLAEKIAKTEGAENGFWGTCHGGVREYVIPIYYDKVLIGAFLVGAFSCEPQRAESSFRRLSRKYGYSYEKLRDRYGDNFTPVMCDEEVITCQLKLCAKYLQGLIIKNIDITIFKAFLSKKYYLHEKQHIALNYAFEFIDNNIDKKITIRDVAERSFCSESTISHLFNRIFGIGVGEYIIRERIFHAKRMLRESNLPISEISEKCGFCYPAYFSNTFKNHTGQTAREYRNSFLKPHTQLAENPPEGE